MSDTVNVASTITKLFENFDEDIKKLEKMPGETEKNTKALASVLYDPKIFFEPLMFSEPFDKIYDDVGHAYATVLLIDLARQRITPQTSTDFLNTFQMMGANQRQANKPVIVQPNAPQLGALSGYWYYKASKEMYKMNQENQKDIGAPQITGEQEADDVLQYGRQLIPNLNLTREVFETDTVIVTKYNDEATITNLLFELRLSVTNLCGIIKVFSRASAEYRKELVGGRKQETGRSVVALEMMQIRALSGGGRRAPFFIDPMGNQMNRRIRDQ